MFTLGCDVSQSTTEDYGSHTVSVTHLNGFGKFEPKADHESVSDTENREDNQKQAQGNSIKVGLKKNDMKNVNKLVSKTVSKSKAFAHLKQQSNNESKSTGGKKVKKINKKFARKSMESKRARHYNPKNTSHKKNKKS